MTDHDRNSRWTATGCRVLASGVVLSTFTALGILLLVRAKSAEPTYVRPLMIELGAGVCLFTALTTFLPKRLRLPVGVPLAAFGLWLLMNAGSVTTEYVRSLSITVGVGIMLFLALERLMPTLLRWTQRTAEGWRTAPHMIGIGFSSIGGYVTTKTLDLPIADAAGWLVQEFQHVLYDEDVWIRASRGDVTIYMVPTGEGNFVVSGSDGDRRLDGEECRDAMGRDVAAEVEALMEERYGSG